MFLISVWSFGNHYSYFSWQNEQNHSSRFNSSCLQSNALQHHNPGDALHSAATAPITALAKRHTKLCDYCIKAASADPSHTPEFYMRTWWSAVALSLALAGGFQMIILLFKHKLLLLTIWIPKPWQMYNYTKAESVNILTVQRIPKNGSFSLPHHIPACTGEVKKPCLVKAQWLELWTSGIDWPVWKQGKEMSTIYCLKQKL